MHSEMHRPTKVLIVSGDARIREPAAEILLREGFVVDEAATAEEALASASARKPPDVVLVDATQGPDGIWPFLDEIGRRFESKAVLLSSFRTPVSMREHPSVVYALDAPAGIENLVSLADWIGERDPHTRPSLVSRPPPAPRISARRAS